MHRSVCRYTPAMAWVVQDKNIPLMVLICVTLLCLGPTAIGANVCAGCENGGRLLLPGNIFGLCRCVCPGGFVGARCQLQEARKRSRSDGLLTDVLRVSAMLRSDRFGDSRSDRSGSS
ncbi:hypothetical protein LSAT2_004424 [Lamellibrachia satsuma]|nr:hypothetical protein LSAT2_004424 [Lamellibrachia satsuma]